MSGDEPVIGGARKGGAWAPVVEARAGPSREPVVGDLAGREAEEFLVPSWTEGVATATEEEQPDRSRKLVREIIETALLALLVFLAVRATLQNYLVEGYSMFPTLDNGQHILVNKVGYAEVNMDRLTDFIPFVDAEDGDVRQVFGGPQRGDIIVFESTAGSGNDLIKRVIGLPGNASRSFREPCTSTAGCWRSRTSRKPGATRGPRSCCPSATTTCSGITGTAARTAAAGAWGWCRAIGSWGRRCCATGHSGTLACRPTAALN